MSIELGTIVAVNLECYRPGNSSGKLSIFFCQEACRQENWRGDPRTPYLQSISKAVVIPPHWVSPVSCWSLHSSAWNSELSSCLVCLILRHPVQGASWMNSHSQFKKALNCAEFPGTGATKMKKASPWKQGAHKPFGMMFLHGDFKISTNLHQDLDDSNSHPASFCIKRFYTC